MAFERIAEQRIRQAMNDGEFDALPNAGRLIDFLVAAVPPAAAVLATVTSLVNLWLAARIVNFSGLLKRPWPQRSRLEAFPPFASKTQTWGTRAPGQVVAR